MTKKVEALVPLQAVDMEIHKIRRQMTVKPAQLAQLASEVETRKKSVEAVKDEIKQLRMEQGRFDLEMKEKDEQIKKLQGSSLQAKKNEEYLAIMKQISGVEADKKSVEERWLTVDYKIDDANKRLKERQEELEEAEKRHAEEKKRIEAEVAALKVQLDEIESRRKGLLGGIDPELLSKYERILTSKVADGMALARVVRHPLFVRPEKKGKKKGAPPGPPPERGIDEFSWSCEGCQVGLTTQDVNMLLMGRDVILCRNCSRILYIAEPVPKQTTPS